MGERVYAKRPEERMETMSPAADLVTENVAALRKRKRPKSRQSCGEKRHDADCFRRRPLAFFKCEIVQIETFVPHILKFKSVGLSFVMNSFEFLKI